MTETDIKQSLVQFFQDQFDIELPSTSEDLIEAGILDSLMLIELVVFIESDFSVATELDDLEMENFVSIDSMARFVTARQPASDPGEPAATTASSAPSASVKGE